MIRPIRPAHRHRRRQTNERAVELQHAVGRPTLQVYGKSAPFYASLVQRLYAFRESVVAARERFVQEEYQGRGWQVGQKWVPR
jgi:hypothetical protein